MDCASSKKLRSRAMTSLLAKQLSTLVLALSASWKPAVQELESLSSHSHGSSPRMACFSPAIT